MHNRPIIHRWLVVALAASLGSTGLRAQQPAAAPALNIEQRLEQLEQEIRLLKRQRENEQEAAAEKVKSTPVLVAGQDGFTLKSADGNLALRLRGQLKADGRFYLDDDAQQGTDTFVIRSARPIFDGTLFRDFGFRIAPEFGNGSTVLQDAYLYWSHWPALKLQAGKFKGPVGLERLQADTDSWFPELALPSSLVPNRDVGIQLSGAVWDGAVQYAVGVFNGVADGASGDLDVNDGKDVDARLFVLPFKNTTIKPLKGLGLGLAGTYGDQDSAVSSPDLPSYKTAGQLTFFKYLVGSPATVSNTVVASGNRSRLAPQGYYYWGPFGLLGEWTYSEQEVQKLTTRDHLRHTAWQVAASWVLTGENSSYTGVAPQRPFDITKGNWGAWELVGRYNELAVDKDAFPTYADPTKSARRASAWGVGLNWYLTRNLRTILAYEQTEFEDGAAGGKDRPTEHALFTRCQVVF